MDLGVHLPLVPFGEERVTFARVLDVVDAARECGFAAVAANDHLVFRSAWVDGPTALASVIERSGGLELALTAVLAVVRGPVPLAKAIAAVDVLSGGRLVPAVAPGSSERDYDAVGLPFEERWPRFDAALRVLRALLDGQPPPADGRYYGLGQDLELLPVPRPLGRVPLWVASWGSRAGVRRVARAGDGWLASAYNTSPERFGATRAVLAETLEEHGRPADGFPNALATMWTWVSERREECERVLADVLGPLVGRDPDELRGRVCVGSAEHCAELLARYRDAGCGRVYLWPLGDERRQLELVAGAVAPAAG